MPASPNAMRGLKAYRARQQGAADFKAGRPSDDCPYSSDFEADAWEQGFWDAEAGHDPDDAEATGEQPVGFR